MSDGFSLFDPGDPSNGHPAGATGAPPPVADVPVYDDGGPDDPGDGRRGMWAMALVVAIAVAVAVLAFVLLVVPGSGVGPDKQLAGPSGLATSGSGPTQVTLRTSNGIATNSTARKLPAYSAPPPKTTAIVRSSTSTTNAPPPPPDTPTHTVTHTFTGPCAVCAIDGDGGALQALNTYRAERGLSAVGGGAAAAAQNCAVDEALGSQGCSSPSAVAIEISQDGSQAVQDVVSAGSTWFSDRRIAYVEIGWAYDGEQGSGRFYCVFLGFRTRPPGF